MSSVLSIMTSALKILIYCIDILIKKIVKPKLSVLFQIFRALVGMMMYNPETNDIAKPSELLNSVKAIMSVLQGIENYGKWRFQCNS